MRFIRFLFFLMMCSFSGKLSAQTLEEANLKAVFIYNFTKYIDWDNNNNDFTIGIVGPSPLIPALNEIAKHNTVKNKKINIKVFYKAEDIEYCNVLFIPQKNTIPLQSLLDKTGRGTLTVSEENGYAKKGTAFNFVIINDKLKFEANLKSLYLAGLKAGSQLLKLGIIVD